MFKKKMFFNYVMFEKEEDADCLRMHIDTLTNKYHLRVVTVFVNETYWKLVCEGSQKTWQEFMSSKTTRFTVKKLGNDDTFTYIVNAL